MTLDDLSNTEFFFLSLFGVGFVYFALVLVVFGRARKLDGAQARRPLELGESVTLKKSPGRG